MPRNPTNAFSNATAIAERKVRQSRAMQAESVRDMVRLAFRKIATKAARIRTTMSGNAKA